MSTAAQISANQANSKLSTGPVSEAGRAISSMNNFRHGFAGKFRVLPSENQADFEALAESLRAEHEPATVTEEILVQRMAEHVWLSRRAQILQDFSPEKCVPLFLRYETTNERAFHKCLDQLLKLRAEKRKIEIGFESQKRKEAEEARKQADEQRKQADDKRKQEAHEARVRLAISKAEWQELNTDIKRTIEAPLPCNSFIPFEDLKPVLTASIREAMRNKAA